MNGARPPISFQPIIEQMLGNLGGKSDWSGASARVFCRRRVSLVDDPGAKDFHGTPLIGAYAVDDEGVRAEKVNVVENGTLKELLMSRRPGNDSNQSNGHGRSAFLTDAKPTMSNLFFSSTETVSPAELKKKFLDECRSEKLAYCMIVREMDNPSISLLHQEDFSELLASYGGGAGTGDRLPLIVYKIYPEDGREEVIRGARIIGVNTRVVAQSRGHRQRQLRLQLHAEPDCGLRGHGARRVWLGARRACRLRWWLLRCCSKSSKCAARAASPSGCRCCRLRR